ncbi:MAG: cell division protein FtsQ/DivIB [Alphaproteobacteria bacterium]|nr:cell division protein FtsQ/DivIB [Alphaproteobacteria bacterium]
MKKQTKKKVKTGFWTLKRRIFVTVLMFVVVCCALFSVTPQGKKIWVDVKKTVSLFQEKARLELSDVPIQGHNRTSASDINDLLHLTQGMPILDIDLNETRDKIMTLPWVRNVIVERCLPNMMIITIEEKTPIAVWQHHKKYLPIDEDGKPIADNKTVISNVLLVVGEDAPKHTPQLMKELEKYPTIKKYVKSAVRVGKRRWDLYLNDAEKGLVVRLPETDIEHALKRLKEFQETGQILDRDINVIDLKLPDRLIIRSDGFKPEDKKQQIKKK